MIGQTYNKTKAVALALACVLLFFMLTGLQTMFLWGADGEHSVPEKGKPQKAATMSMTPAPQAETTYQAGTVTQDVKHERESRMDLFFSMQGGVIVRNDVYGYAAFKELSPFSHRMKADTEVMRC